MTQHKKYIHGYTPKEQKRLFEQAKFLEFNVYPKIDFSSQTHILEVGCGVGAQTDILLRRFPHLKISGVDSAAPQIEQAKKHLRGAISKQKVDFHVANAEKLKFKKNSFDGSFVCWFLEHVSKPVPILKEIRRVLRPRSVIYCSEVTNQSFFLEPYSPATLQYWFAFNDHQWNMGGDPFVGLKLGNYLLAAGFKDITTESRVLHFDNRNPEMRRKFIDYSIDLFTSGAPALIRDKRVTPELVEAMRGELNKIKKVENSVIYLSYMQAKAFA